jgi:hypothetical protein
MKKLPGKVIMQVILPERYLTEALEEQGKNDQGKNLPPQLVQRGPVLCQRLTAEQEVF